MGVGIARKDRAEVVTDQVGEVRPLGARWLVQPTDGWPTMGARYGSAWSQANSSSRIDLASGVSAGGIQD